MGFTPEQIRKMAEEAKDRMRRGESPNRELRPELLDRDDDEIEVAKARAREAAERLAESRAVSGRPRPPQIRKVEERAADSPEEERPDLEEAARAMAGGPRCLQCGGARDNATPVCGRCISAKAGGSSGYGA